MMMPAKTVVIFGSSAAEPGETLYSAAEELGRLLAVDGYTVCNGGYDGIMAASAKGAKQMGGNTVGITTKSLEIYERNRWIDDEIICDTYADRMRVFFGRGDAFIALPGGVGTFSEVFSLWCLFAIRETLPKPFILIGEPWRTLLEFLTARFVFRLGEMQYLTLVNNAREAIESLDAAFGGKRNHQP